MSCKHPECKQDAECGYGVNHTHAVGDCFSIAQFMEHLAKLTARADVTGIAVVLHTADKCYSYQFGLDQIELQMSGDVLLEFSNDFYEITEH